MYYVYILQSTLTSKYYIGQTNNLEDRLSRHNSGRVKSTKNYMPWILVLNETYQTRSEAMNREKEIKSYKGGNAFKKLVLR